MPQAFYQRVNHNKSSYNPIDVHRLLLAMMAVRQPLVPEAFAHLVVNEQSRFCIAAMPRCRRSFHHGNVQPTTTD